MGNKEKVFFIVTEDGKKHPVTMKEIARIVVERHHSKYTDQFEDMWATLGDATSNKKDLYIGNEPVLLKGKMVPGYFKTMKQYEDVFKSILKDIKDNNRHPHLPKNFNPEAPLEQLIVKYHPVEGRKGKNQLTIRDFEVGPSESDSLCKLMDGEAMLELGYRSITHRGEGFQYKYRIKGLEFQGVI